MEVKKKDTPSLIATDFNSAQDLARFRAASKVFTERATKSRASARKALIDAGIYTKAGKLAKHLR